MGFGAILLAAGAAFVAIAVLGLDGQQKTLEMVSEVDDRVSAVNFMIVAQLEAAVSVRNAAAMSNARAVKAELQTYYKALTSLRDEEAAFFRRGLDDSSKTLLDAALVTRQQSEPIVEEAMNFVMVLAGEEGARVLRDKLAPVQARWTEQLKLLAANERRLGVEKIAAARRSELVKIASLGATLLCIIGGGIVFAVLLARSVTRPLRSATEIADRVAQGDLTAEIRVVGKDEAADMLRSLQTMAARLSEMVHAVQGVTDSISVASEQISRGNLDLSNRTEVQAASLQKTSTWLSELTDAVASNKDHADAARKLAERAASSAEEGSSSMSQVTSTMAGISESSRRIADIVGVIDGIAFQTNLLALNAAVEAAGAGERGRGFAVVANEVRALAQRAAASASEVRALVSESMERVEAGCQQVSSLGVTMKELLGGAHQVSRFVGEIANACGSQRESIGSVSDALREVDGITQQNAALVEEMAAAAQSLVQQMQTLGALVGQFRIGAQENRRPSGVAVAEGAFLAA